MRPYAPSDAEAVITWVDDKLIRAEGVNNRFVVSWSTSAGIATLAAALVSGRIEATRLVLVEERNRNRHRRRRAGMARALLGSRHPFIARLATRHGSLIIWSVDRGGEVFTVSATSPEQAAWVAEALGDLRVAGALPSLARQLAS